MILTKPSRYNVNTNYGTAADLLALSKALHSRGMYLMVDVVANHMVCTLYTNLEASFLTRAPGL
jgi:maltooligosyltrehalose synthase